MKKIISNEVKEMIEFQFNNYNFKVDEKSGRLRLNGFPLSEIQLAGGARPSLSHNLCIGASEAETLRFVSHEIKGNQLCIVEKNKYIEVVTSFISYGETNGVAVEKTIKNISGAAVKIETAATLVLGGAGVSAALENADKTYFTKFVQSHHAECQPRRFSLFDFGFFQSYARNFKKLSCANIGSWSTKEELPLGIIENAQSGEFLMFEIESNHNWYYEISATGEEFYLALCGNASPAHRYEKTLQPNKTYSCARVAVCFGKSLNETLGEMTKYRRHIAGKCAADEKMPVIFNEYMHLSWDSPREAKTKIYAPKVAEAGAEYYVIDCGWHDDMPDGVWVYPYMGRWRESRKNFPRGVRAITDYIRTLGMKAGLWIEPEIVGEKCEEMLAYYDDDCFLKRNGERIRVGEKYILDFRAEKVRAYLTETIRRMAEDYGADYIKMDYNVDAGFVDGDFEEERRAYLAWADDLRARFKNVLFETCSSGGMRMDYETLKHFSIVSTSDQVRDFLYPYIAGNVLAGVLPEQAAVWSYPVSSREIWTLSDGNVSAEKVVLNMINAFLGRMHLASDLTKLSEENFTLVKEGVEYSKKLAKVKKASLPYFPLGFTDFSKDTVACGLKANENGKEKLYLAVWVLRGNRTAKIPIGGAKGAKVAYPKNLSTEFELGGEVLTVKFAESNSARFFEIEL